MPKIEMMLQHGWGLNHKMWKKFIKFFPDAEIHALDQGYFHQEKSYSFTSLYSFKIGVVHSLGLHIFPQKFFSSLDVLIIFSSFLNFHKGSSNKILSLMKSGLKKEPKTLLNNFHQQAFNHKIIVSNISKINQEKLEEDLHFLGNASFDINLIKDTSKILLFHSKNDKIIPFEKSLEIKSKLEKIELHAINGFSHMLPITNLDEVIPLIKKHIPQNEKTFKENVIHSFTKRINNYEENNHFQKKSNEDLTLILKKIKIKIPEGSILEIGSGTGHFTKSLIQHLPNKKLEITDICKAMVDHCEKKFLNENVLFSVLDGERLEKKNAYSMVASAMAIQWFYDFEKSFKTIWEALKENGIFLFSFLEKDSFLQWKNIYSDNSLNPLPSLEEVRYFLNKNHFSIGYLEKNSYTITYPSIISFLQNLKKTGANASLFQNHKNLYSLLPLLKKEGTGSFPITYLVGIGIAFK